jgi:hypothetical protein
VSLAGNEEADQMLTGLKRGLTPINLDIALVILGVLRGTTHVGFPRSMVGNTSRNVYVTDSLTSKVLTFRYDEWEGIYVPVLESLSAEGTESSLESCRDYWSAKQDQDAIGIVEARLQQSYESFLASS